MNVDWHRFHDADFRLGQDHNYVLLNLLRAVFSVWLVAAVAAYGGWVIWSEQQEARQISDALVEGGYAKKEFRANTCSSWCRRRKTYLGSKQRRREAVNDRIGIEP